MDFHTLVQSFSGLHIGVVGDAMLDVYEFGEVERISPEAPVPVVRLKSKEIRPGGAANVACNLSSLGANVSLFSIVGVDESANQLIRLLTSKRIETANLVSTTSRPTTTKTRILSGGKQVIRLDLEDDHSIGEIEQQLLLNHVLKHLPQLDVLIFQDYDKGVLNENLIRKLIQACNFHGVKTAIDPKFRNFRAYHGADFFKPNLKETKEALRLAHLEPGLMELELVANQLMESQSLKQIMITLSEHGVFYMNQSESGIWPAHLRSIADVSGAGDTVISVAALCLGANLSLSLTAALSNLAGGLACESIGAVSLLPSQLANEATLRLAPDFQFEN